LLDVCLTDKEVHIMGRRRPTPGENGEAAAEGEPDPGPLQCDSDEPERVEHGRIGQALR
jgi:hypothetical protein